MYMPKSHLVIYKMSFVPCIETEKMDRNPIRKEHIFYTTYFFLPFLTSTQTKKEMGQER